jgi:TP901-1 family phage major tail protein
MAVNTTPINGSDVFLQISEDSGSSYDTVMFLTSANLSASMDVRDISNKSSAGWREILEAQKSWSLSGDGFVTYSTVTDSDNTGTLVDFLSNRTKIFVKFTIGSYNASTGGFTANSGDSEYYGEAYVTSIEQSSGVEDNLGFSVSFEGTGVLTKATIS